MDYKRIYDTLIERAKQRKVEGYTEKHHIIPKCMGGSNDKDNLVELTAREHFIVHKLLCEIYPENNDLKTALLLMSTYGKYKVSSREYERLKILRSEHMGIVVKNWWDSASVSDRESRCKKISEACVGRTLSDKTKNKIKNALKGRTFSDEHIDKLREASSGKNNAMYGMNGSLNPFYGKKHSEESRKKIKANHADFSRGKHPQAKSVVHIETGVIFECGRDASEFYKISPKTVSNHCNNKIKNKKFRFLNDSIK